MEKGGYLNLLNQYDDYFLDEKYLLSFTITICILYYETYRHGNKL